MPDEGAKLNPNSPRNPNLAAAMSAEERSQAARAVCQWWRYDKEGRKDWEDRRNRYYKLWLGVKPPKSDPWPGASNVCLPLLAISCNQFHARSYQAFFAPSGMVKCLPVAANDVARAKKCEGFMDWQVMNDVPNYEDQTDKLLLNVPISGTNFKKGYYDPDKETPVFDYVSGMQVVLPYRTKTIEDARRICHEVWLHYDELEKRAQSKPGFYVDFEKVQKTPGQRPEEEMDRTKDEVETEAFHSDEMPKLFLECHGWWRKGDKGPWEPVIMTVDYDSETLVRMTSRKFGNAVLNHWTDYSFLPNPEGFYSFGFGHFLETLNEMANTAFNQIFDAGRISNQPFGFYGRRSGLRQKTIQLWPGKMIEVEDAQQVFFPNMQRVDQVLFQVLGIIQQYSEQFTSTSDYLLGREAKGVKNPTATGTTAIIEQGLILYSVMIKRLFRSLKKELRHLFSLNQLFLPESKTYRVMGFDGPPIFPEIKRADFDGRLDVIPLGDPSYASRITRRQEAQELYTLMLNNPLVVANPNVQVLNPKALLAVTREVMETYDRKELMGTLPDLPEESLSPIAENALFMQGDSHDPKPGENHPEHFKVHYQFINSELFKSLPEDFQKLAIEHLRMTQALMYAEAANAAALGGAGSGTPMGPPPVAGAAPAGGATGASPSVPTGAPAGPSPVPAMAGPGPMAGGMGGMNGG